LDWSRIHRSSERRIIARCATDQIVQRSGRQRDDTRDRAIALLVVGDHAPAETEGARCLVQGIGFALAPMPKGRKASGVIVFATDDDRYVLRARLAQELRRIIDRVVLNSDREILVVFKPMSGCGARMEFRNGRFETLKLIDLHTGETTEVPRELFLETQRHLLSQ
jgi:hypothetical protein